MHEAGEGIITHATAAERESGIAQRQGIDSRDANIDRVSLHMQAILCDADRAGAEEFIAPGGTVAADDIDLPARMTDSGGEIEKNVEDARIVVLDVAGAMIAKEMVELFFGLRNIKIAAPVNDVDAFTGVRMIEAKIVFLGGRIVRNRVPAALCGSGKKDQG
jgi:hypothetical protein